MGIAENTNAKGVNQCSEMVKPVIYNWSPSLDTPGRSLSVAQFMSISLAMLHYKCVPRKEHANIQTVVTDIKVFNVCER